MRIPVLTASFILLAVPAFAQDAAMPVPATPSAAASPALSGIPTERKEVTGVAPNPMQQISCVQSDPPTGSRLGAHKTCHTQADWNNIRANSALTMMDMQTRHDNGLEGEQLAQGH